jgi:hypothetical protein
MRNGTQMRSKRTAKNCRNVLPGFRSKDLASTNTLDMMMTGNAQSRALTSKLSEGFSPHNM